MPATTTADLSLEMTAWRQDFHAHPELGFAEVRTAARVADLLESFGLEVHRGIGQTGVVGILQRGNGTRSVGLRADMDALPIRETTGAAYASRTGGVMHACGHDGHMAMLLGAAKHLAAHGQFDGRVVFIFQPAEEHGQGAQAMIADGLFERFGVDQVFAIHNMPGLPVGHLETRAGPMTASEALFEIEVRARGGHAALPHLGVDAIVVGAQIVGALQTIVSRKLDPAQNGVVSVTEFIADGGRNILPGSAVLKGDARALSPETNRLIEARMRELVAGTAAAHDVTAEVAYQTVFAPTINDADAVAAVARAGSVALGAANVDAACFPKLFSEDFAHMAMARPGCFFLMGNGTDGAHGLPLHASGYDFNDDGLVPGADTWVHLVQHALPAA
ncbi:M20 aminoacylase family protein [Pseudosulfitobacter koreensis]|uniref:M20 family metallopeptidase n=1 Tax=Pseudosulfitobacter koreensis TaxID=2968472 RepID=A0ABT1Z3Q4_9RHOB|nr:M20 aminoacylase family protein [Pseudosulfitobacter koreense]MCR8827728.1 M20 family metallopeptidase [Pseudosulfitobacter koreense]